VEADENADWKLTDFAKRVLGASQGNLEHELSFLASVNPENPASVDTGSPDEAPIEAAIGPTEHPSAHDASDSTADQQEVQPRKFGVDRVVSEPKAKTPGEMADIILGVLRSVRGVPERGFQVTVYGANPWNAMLTITPEAGPVRDAQIWRTRVQDIGARLRQDFELIY
jgi:hypothetical protein